MKIIFLLHFTKELIRKEKKRKEERRKEGKELTEAPNFAYCKYLIHLELSIMYALNIFQNEQLMLYFAKTSTLTQTSFLWIRGMSKIPKVGTY